jgi:hypothetical protein
MTAALIGAFAWKRVERQRRIRAAQAKAAEVRKRKAKEADEG